MLEIDIHEILQLLKEEVKALPESERAAAVDAIFDDLIMMMTEDEREELQEQFAHHHRLITALCQQMNRRGAKPTATVAEVLTPEDIEAALAQANRSEGDTAH